MFDVSQAAIHFSLIAYSQEAGFYFNFSNGDFWNHTRLKETIQSLPWIGLQTRTDKALELAEATMFTAENGDRENVPNTLIVITFGRTDPSSKPYALMTFKVWIHNCYSSHLNGHRPKMLHMLQMLNIGGLRTTKHTVSLALSQLVLIVFCTFRGKQRQIKLCTHNDTQLHIFISKPFSVFSTFSSTFFKFYMID